jgi:hypothetical protein
MNIYFGYITVKYFGYHIITYWTIHNKRKYYFVDICHNHTYIKNFWMCSLSRKSSFNEAKKFIDFLIVEDIHYA